MNEPTRIPLTPCPYCDYPMDAASSANPENWDAAPEPGCLTVCLSCTSILVFTTGLKLRKPYYGEIDHIFMTDKPVADKVRSVQRIIRGMDRTDLKGFKRTPTR